MNYISREAVIKELDTMYDNMNSMGARFYNGFMLARHTVNDFPAADVREVVRAEWLPPAVGKYGCVCGHCKSQLDNRTDFCPNCGAMMGGQDNDN